MWSRESIKTYAKGFLRKHYWKAFLVCLIVSILGSYGSDSNTQVKRSNTYYYEYGIFQESNEIPMEINNPVLNLAIRKIGKSPIFFVARRTVPLLIIFFALLTITIGFALNVGRSRFFLKGFKEDVSIAYLFSTFNSKEYIIIVKTMFLRWIYTFLWSLLLIIPGIIKSFEYRMVPYILSENPNLSPNEVITKSREMTEGHKWDMFVLDLSFIGWDLLGLLFFGIGGHFVNPYREATMTRLYNILSSNDNIDEDVIIVE